MILPPQLEKKAKKTKAVKPLNLPRRNVQVKPGDVCYVAGWGKTDPKGDYSNTLQEVELTVQKDQECESRFQGFYNKATAICVGDPKINRAFFKVSWIVLSWLHGRRKAIWDLESKHQGLLCPLTVILLPGNREKNW